MNEGTCSDSPDETEAPTGYTADLIRALEHLAFEYRLNQNMAGTLQQAADEISRLSAAEPSGPYLHDRANGVHGIYCIARKRDGVTEYWTGQKWAAFCNDLYFDLRSDIKPTDAQRTKKN